MDKPRVKLKCKPPPPYPRPMPFLEIEELHPRPEDFAWSAHHAGGYYSDEDEDKRSASEVERRAAKRQRIEACAHAFLRGEHLQIVSARLKGPFEDGWQNPWAKKRKLQSHLKMEPHNPLEIPETTKKIVSGIDEEKTVQPSTCTLKIQPVPRDNQHDLPKTMGTGLDHPPSPFTSKVQKISDKLPTKVPRQVKEKRIEEWLRTNDDFAQRGEVVVHSSPTPSSRQCQTPRRSDGGSGMPQASQSEPSRVAVPVHSNLQALTSERSNSTDRLSGTTRQLQKLSRGIQTVTSEPIAYASDNLCNETRKLIRDTVPDSFEEPARAEHAILKSRFGALQTAPADAHMSPFEFRKLINKGGQPHAGSAAHGHGSGITKATRPDHSKPAIVEKESSVVELLSNGEALTAPSNPTNEAFATAPPPKALHDVDSVETANIASSHAIHAAVNNDARNEVKAPTNDTAFPALITAVSDASTTNMLPSAQLQPNLHSTPSLARDEKFISINRPISNSDKTDRHEINTSEPAVEKMNTQNEHASTPIMAVETNDQHPPSNHNAVDASTPVCVPNAASLNTQEMLANIEPFNLSTIKKIRVSAKKDPPVTATKVTAGGKRKKASFVGDASSMTSHSSIKDSMKARIGKKLGSPPAFLLGKDNLDIELSDEENESHSKRPRLYSGSSKPKSVLKSTNPALSPTSLRKSKNGFPTRQGQSGYLPSGQNGIEEEKFDLDAAIDDLGSFLGTWDAEKEAVSLDIEL